MDSDASGRNQDVSPLRRATATAGLFFTPRSLLSSPTMRLTAWVRSYSTSAPGVRQERIETGHGFGRLAVDDDSVWAINAVSRTATRIDRRHGQIASQTKLGRVPGAIAPGTEAVWVLCRNGWLWRFRPNGESEGIARLDNGARGLACIGGTVWVLHASGRLVGLDEATGEVAVESRVRRGGRQLLVADGALVAISAKGSQAVRVDAESGAIEADAKLPTRAVRATVHDGTLWVVCGRRLAPRWGVLVPVDLGTMSAGSARLLPSAPRAICADAAHLWVACGRKGHKKSSIVRIEPESGKVEPWADTEWTIYDLAIAGDQLLAATGLALAGPAGGEFGGGVTEAGAGGSGGSEGGGGN